MFFTLTFAAMAVGPLFGTLGGMLPYWNGITVASRAKLIGGMWAWSFAAAAGTIVGAFICCNTTGGAAQHAFSIFGAGVNGIIWTGWIASMVGCVVGVYAADLHSKE